MQETHRIELKVQLTDDLEKEVVAFLNAREGGEIYIGYADDGNPLGISDADKDLLKIKDRLKTNVSPSIMGLYDLELLEVDGKDIIKLSLASGSEKPYFLTSKGMSPKGCYIRKGTAAEPMNQSMIDDLYSKRTRSSLRTMRSSKQDLSFEQLKIYYQEIDLQLNDNFATTLELLTEDGAYNYVAYLISDNNSNSIKLASYAGTDREKLIETEDLGFCSLMKTAKSILTQLELRNSKHTAITGQERTENQSYDPISLREAVINALVHNDYSREVTPKFELFTDRIEITSSGGLPAGLSESEYFAGYSVPRNKEVIRIFRDLRLVEQLGSGVPRILKHYGKECFTFMDNFLRITFPNFLALVAKEIEKIGNEEKESKLVDGLVERLVDGLVESQKKVVYLIANNSEVTISEMAESVGISTTAIEKNLTRLKEKNIIRRVGSNRKGGWVIVKEKRK